MPPLRRDHEDKDAPELSLQLKLLGVLIMQLERHGGLEPEPDALGECPICQTTTKETSEWRHLEPCRYRGRASLSGGHRLTTAACGLSAQALAVRRVRHRVHRTAWP